MEFEEAVRYYRARGRVLGDRFAAEVRFAIRRILETPERWRVLEEDVRRCLVRVFPYSVLYTIEPGFILIVAVMHGKRQPGYWRYRVGTEVE
jgi:plasmid stabilization system protein ParE